MWRCLVNLNDPNVHPDWTIDAWAINVRPFGASLLMISSPPVDAINNVPQPQQIRCNLRMSPEALKVFAYQLCQNVRQYERTSGAINVSPATLNATAQIGQEDWEMFWSKVAP